MPIIIRSEPDTCPECKQIEKKIEICAHCGHVYPDEGLTKKDVVIVIFMLLIFLWIVITLTSWLGGFEDSLIKTIINQIRYVSNLRII